ncbi:MAG: prolyl oligopeptidase family serine peptidase [Candidatus Paceibacterota bacterium]|jgi:dipeptidyl aminopeptidase/acylaminoacyl peptidase
MHSKKIFKGLLTAIFLFVIFPTTIHALPFLQGKVVDYDATNVIVSYSDMKTEKTYHCPFTTLVCEKVGEREIPPPSIEKVATPTPPTATTITPKPSIGILQAYSSSGRYTAAYSGIHPTKKTRSFKLLDTSTNTSYDFGKSTSKSTWDLMREGNRLISFAPSEKFFVYMDDRSGFQTLYKVSLPIQDKVTETQLISKKYTVTDFIVWDDNTIFFTANREAPYEWNLYKYDIEKETVKKVIGNVSYGPSLLRVHDMLMFSVIHSTQADPTFYDPATNKIRELSLVQASNAPINQKAVKIGSVSGVLMPSGVAKSHPLIIWLHGGPYRQTSLGYHSFVNYNRFEYILQEAQSAGASVLKLDYSGSFGYGRAFSENLYKNVGMSDVSGVKNAIDYMKKPARPDNPLGGKEKINKVYVMGNSYGGYLAMRSLVAYPGTINGAITISGVSDWKKLLDDLQTSIFNALFDGRPLKKNPTIYNNASIVNRLSRLKGQKIMIVHGVEDKTIPLEQSALLYEATKNSTLITYPLEDHVFVQESTILDLCKKTIEFVGLSVGGRCK